jgi:hypothetical protein
MLRLHSNLNDYETLASHASSLAAWHGLSAARSSEDVGAGFKRFVFEFSNMQPRTKTLRQIGSSPTYERTRCMPVIAPP